MTIEYFGVYSHPADSRDTLRLKLGGDVPVSHSCKIAIERPGQNNPYLARSGWQSNYSREVIEVVFSDSKTFDLCLPTNLTRFLDSEHNYKVELFDMTDSSLGMLGINWRPPPRTVTPAPPPEEPEEERMVVESVHNADFLDIAPPEPADPEPLIQPADTKRPSGVNRIVENCAQCGGQIFSTFTVCPYCRTPLRKSRVLDAEVPHRRPPNR
jgi:hypothetical protein